MSRAQVEGVLGKPDGFKHLGEFTLYKYADRVISSNNAHSRADYSFIFKSDELVEYGTGPVRQTTVGGVHSVFIYQ